MPSLIVITDTSGGTTGPIAPPFYAGIAGPPTPIDPE
jgi:hypothetical protein